MNEQNKIDEQLTETSDAPSQPAKKSGKPAPRKPRAAVSKIIRLLLQLVLAGVFSALGIILLLSTLMLVYSPMKLNNQSLSEQRLADRMQLSGLIADAEIPGMNVDDELSEIVLRMLDKKKDDLRAESTEVAQEIEVLRSGSEDIAQLLHDTGYDTIEMSQIVSDAYATDKCLKAMNLTVDVLDTKLDKLGINTLKEEIAAMKGTTTTVTKEDENGEVITETVVVGGLIDQAKAKQAELQKKCDDLQAKLDDLEAYLNDNQGRITAMYNRLEQEEKAGTLYAKMEAITAYVKQAPDHNIFMQDTMEKLSSFPGETKEEDDILFIMKVESETGIRMQTVNYGQDYQHKQLSNGMMMCFELYSIPYYATYDGLKNLITYFNDNDDFYASVYTLSMEYNPQNESIQGVMVILHYYLLEEGAEYVPPVIDEDIIPGIDSIFGDMTDNGKPNGPLSNYSPDDIESWLDQGQTLEQVRERLVKEGYPETELLWILKKKYQEPDEIQEFLEKYGDDSVDYTNRIQLFTYLKRIFPNTDTETLLHIYNAKVPEDTTTKGEDPEDPEEGTTGGENPENPEEGTTGTEDPEDPEEGTTGGEDPEDPEEGTTGGEDPEDPEEGTTGGENPENPEEGTTGGEKPEDTTENDKPQEPSKPTTGKQSDYTAEDVENMMNNGMSLEEVRDQFVAEGYPAIELAWVLSEKYHTETEIMTFMLAHDEMDQYQSLSDVTDLFDCSLSDLKKIYNQ